MTFEFATASRILFGEGVLNSVSALASELGNRILVVSGGSPVRSEPLLALLEEQRLPVSTLSVIGEPTVAAALEGTEQARDYGVDLVIGMGGGSVIDAAKAIAALLTNSGDPFNYLEIIGHGRPLADPAAPLVAIPTTAGTGAEVTRNAVLTAPEQGVKVSLRHRSMLPRIALIDPVLTYTVPPAITASTGLDALTQCLEPFVSHLATPLTDGFCREGMRCAARSLRRVFHAGSDIEARRDMALASLCGGLALSNAKLGAVHGLAAPIGGMFNAPHGAVCARLLPFVMETNVRALEERTPTAPALARYREVAAILTGDATAEVADGIAWIRALSDELAMPGLTDYGLTRSRVAAIVDKAMLSSSIQGNPTTLTKVELTALLTLAL